MELRVRGEHAVLRGQGAAYTREIDARELPVGAELADALHEWARVAAAVLRAGESGEAGPAAEVVSRRGQQLAARLATVLGTPVHYVDPLTEQTVLIRPAPRPAPRPSLARRLFGPVRDTGEPTPWGTGLIVAGFVAVVVITAMLALADALATEVAGWLVVLASLVVTAGLAPSLWLARRLLVVRWIALGAAAGFVIAWFGVLAIAL